MEGPAGILRVLERRKIKHRYKMSPRPMVLFPNGAKIYTEGADDPDVGRGYNASGAWLDEICIAKNEPVVTIDGPKRIQDVVVGDLVFTRKGWRPVESAGLTRQDAAVIEIVTDLSAVRLTPEHRVWSGGEWREAKDLKVGDLIRGQYANVPIKGIYDVANSDVYDLTVEGDAPEFFAGRGLGVLVHNCKWRQPRRSWYEGIMPSLRASLVADHPRVFVTTTPKPIDIIQEWIRRDDGTVHVIRGSTFDNAANLSPLAVQELERRYAGTIIGRQELYGELIEHFDGALFSRLDMENNRVDDLPDDIVGTVVGIDPSLTGEDDEMGIVVVSKDVNNHLYVVSDRSVMSVGRAAALHSWRVFAEYGADMMVCEVTLSKRWMEQVFHDAYRELCEAGLFEKGSRVPFKGVEAKVGKRTRGEPVAMRSEQGRLHMVGRNMTKLEDQMATFTAWGTSESPDRLDALVHACRWMIQGEKKQARIASPSDTLSTTLQQLWREVESW